MKSLFEQLGGIYSKQSDYFIPNLTRPKGEENHIGIYGQLHNRQFVPKHLKLQERKINPKCMQREIGSQLQDRGMRTKAQQALKLQRQIISS